MNTSQTRIKRAVERLGYSNVRADKLQGQWTVLAFDPLEETSASWPQLGTSVKAALASISALPIVPSYYVCGHQYSCPQCKHYDHPIGYTDKKSGNFMHRCVKCKNTWIAATAAEQEAHAAEIMREARYGTR